MSKLCELFCINEPTKSKQHWTEQKEYKKEQNSIQFILSFSFSLFLFYRWKRKTTQFSSDKIQYMLWNDWQKCTKNGKLIKKKRKYFFFNKKKINNEKIEYDGLCQCVMHLFSLMRVFFLSSFFNSSFSSFCRSLNSTD